MSKGKDDAGKMLGPERKRLLQNLFFFRLQVSPLFEAYWLIFLTGIILCATRQDFMLSPEAMSAILDYLNKQNRPYSAIDIFNNLHKAYGKTAVEKSLETLSEHGKIHRKLYGKQKVYVADQSQFPDVNEGELKSMEGQLSQLTTKLQESEQQNKTLEAELRSYSSALTTEEATRQLAAAEDKCARLKQKLSDLKENNNAVSPEERQKIMASRSKYVKEWKKRKRMAMDILNAILEGYPKSKKDLFEEIGIETDEEYKVKPPEL